MSRPKLLTLLIMLIVDAKSGRFMYQSGTEGGEAKKRKSPAKSGTVCISAELFKIISCASCCPQEFIF